MMRKRGTRILGLLAIFALLALILIWQSYRPVGGQFGFAVDVPDITGSPASSAHAPATQLAKKSVALEASTATSTPVATHAATATANNPTKTLAPTATMTPLPSATASATMIPSATPPNRTCPDPAPPRPDYVRYSLGSAAWATPSAPGTDSHFWLAAPLKLDEDEPAISVNWSFPYGSDGNDRYLLHNGVDISGGMGVPLLAVADGVVVVAQDDYSELYGWRCNWYGHLVVIELNERYLGQPVYVLYGHVLNIAVAVGDRVTTGQQLAEIGIGGASTAPHLHLEVRVDGNEFGMTRNPLLWLQPAEGRGVIAGRLVDPDGRSWHGVEIIAAGPTYATTWSYLDDDRHLTQPDDVLGENFVFGDLSPGEYRVIVSLQGEQYMATVQVTAGEVSQVELITAPFKTPTPNSTMTPTPTLTGTPEGEATDQTPGPEEAENPTSTINPVATATP